MDDLLDEFKRQSLIQSNDIINYMKVVNDLQGESKQTLHEIRTIQQEIIDLSKKSLQITYPSEGGTKTVPAGVTTLNFVTGVTTLPTGNQEDMSESLHNDGDTHCRSILIKSNKPVVIRFDEEGAFSPDAHAYFQIQHKEFRNLRITTTDTETNISVQAFTNPATAAYMSSSASVYSTGETRDWIEMDGDTYFTGAILQNASESENIAINNSEITIVNVSMYSIQQLKYRIWFYSRDTFLADDLLGFVDFDLPATGITKVIGATTYYYYNISDVEMAYRDADITSETSPELHIQIENKSAVAKIAGANGKIQLSISYGTNS